MKQFNVLRYLQKYRWLIFIVAVAGAVLVLGYGLSSQTYTASTVIRYTEGEIPEEMREIYGSAIIDAALGELGYDNVSVDEIRSHFRVDPVVSEENQTMVDAILESGRKPDFKPDTYRISYKNKNESMAFSILDAVVKDYYRYYTEQYATEKLGDNGTGELSIAGFDHVESVETLEKSTAAMLAFLDAKRAVQPDARSVWTGCTYQDLYDAFRYLYMSEIPRLYLAVLSSASSTEADVLVARLERNCDRLREKIAARAEEINHQKELMDNYAGQAEKIFEFQRGSGSTGENFILDETKYAYSGTARTTYDKLMDRYIALRNEYESYVIDLEAQELLLHVFQNSKTQQADPKPVEQDPAESGEEPESADPEKEAEAADLAEVFAYAAAGEKLSQEELQALIDRCAQMYTYYYEKVADTSSELDGILSAKYLETVGSIDVEPSVQIVRYVVIALVLFLIIGVIVAILLGRSAELVENIVFYDRTTDLPNRSSCDQYIAKLDRNILPDHFACVALQLDLRKITAQHGRAMGDTALHDFGSILKGFQDAFGYIAHNGAGQFVAFFEDCSRSKLDTILKMLREKTEAYNHADGHIPVSYSAGSAITTECKEYRIRPLIQTAMENKVLCTDNSAKPETEEAAGEDHA